MKKYIFIMGLMTCMCLITQSCSNQDEYDSSKNDWNPKTGIINMAQILPRGDYQGYWTVWDEKADSCIMTFDGNSLSFSKMPVDIILAILYYLDGSTPISVESGKNNFHEDGGYAHWKSLLESYKIDIPIDAKPFVAYPILMGYSEKTVYFMNDVSKAYMDAQNSAFRTDIKQSFLNSELGYTFSVKTDNSKDRYFLLAFDQENYGVINIQQSSRVIKLYLKEVFVLSPENNVDHMTFDSMIELTFISND